MVRQEWGRAHAKGAEDAEDAEGKRGGCLMLDFGLWMEEGREEKGRPRMGDDGRRCFCCDVTRRSKGGGGRSEARERGKSHQVVLRRALKRPNGRQMAKSS